MEHLGVQTLFEPGDAGEARNERPSAAKQKVAFFFFLLIFFAGLGHSRKPKMVSVESGFDASNLDCKLTGNRLGHREGSKKVRCQSGRVQLSVSVPCAGTTHVIRSKLLIFHPDCMDSMDSMDSMEERCSQARYRASKISSA